MNDFTKEELIKLKNGMDYLPNSVNMSTQYLADCVVIMRKLDKMIQNYCDHEETENIGGWVSKCVKCGMKFGDETQ